MTLEEQRDIIQAAMQDDEIEFIAAQGSYDQEYYSILKGHKFNFFKYNYRIKPKEPEQPDIVKTDIAWENSGENLWFTIAPKSQALHYFNLGKCYNGYRLMGFWSDEIKDYMDQGIERNKRFSRNNDPEYYKATHAVWEKIKC